jgi:hypothetical protein
VNKGSLGSHCSGLKKKALILNRTEKYYFGNSGQVSIKVMSLWYTVAKFDFVLLRQIKAGKDL